MSGNRGGGPRAVPAHGHQLLYHVAGVRRPAGRAGGDACERRARGARPLLGVRHKRVRRVAVAGRAVQHRVHTEPVRHFAGPLLGHHRPVYVSDQDEPETRVPAHSRRLGVRRRHQLPGHHLVAAGPHRPRAAQHVPVHQQHRLSDLLVHHIVLLAAAGHGVHLLQDLHGGCHADPVPEAGHQGAVVHAIRWLFGWWHWRRRRRILGWRIGHRLSGRWSRFLGRRRRRPDGAHASNTPRWRDLQVHVVDGGGGARWVRAFASAAEELLAEPEAQ